MSIAAADPLARASRPSVTPPSKRRIPAKHHAFFVAFTTVFAVLVLAGFSRSFFRPLVNGTLAKPLVVHLHGIFFFGWTVLLILQAVLAATRRLRLHRNIGTFAAWLIIPMLIMGTIVAARDTVHDYHAGD